MGFLIKLSSTLPVYRKQLLNYVKDLPHDSVTLSYKIYCLRRIGLDYFRKEATDSTMYWLNQGVETALKYKTYYKEAAMFYRDMGRYYNSHSNYANGIEFYNKAIGIARKCNSEDIYTLFILELGSIYQSIDENKKALDNFLIALQYAEKHNMSDLTTYALNSIGDLSRVTGNLNKAILYHERALDLYKKANGKIDLWSCTSLGKVYTAKNDFDKAEMYFKMVLEEAKQDVDLISQSYFSLARCEYKKGNREEAIKKCLKAYEVSTTSPKISIRNAIAEHLSQLYSEDKQFEKALAFYKIHKTLEDTINNKAEIKKRAEAEYKTKEEKLVEKNKKEKEKRELDGKKQNIVILFITLALLMALLFSVLIFRSLQKNKTQKKIIQEQKRLVDERQKDVLDSIQYAQRIQQSLLPNEKYIEKQLKRLKEED